MAAKKPMHLENSQLRDRIVLVTGAARRIGRALAQASARAGANVVVHYWRSGDEAGDARREIEALGRKAWTLRADLARPGEATRLVEESARLGTLFALINNAAVFDEQTMQDTALADWERYLAVNLTAPFVLTQAFAARLTGTEPGRVVNILDWRALRPDNEHFAYSVSKAALAAMTKAMALALAPEVSVNGLALGAILPPATKSQRADVLNGVPAQRWGRLQEVEEALLFLLTGPAYVTGEIIHVDGGRHLT